jgi:hypothetical protein
LRSTQTESHLQWRQRLTEPILKEKGKKKQREVW